MIPNPWPVIPKAVDLGMPQVRLYARRRREARLAGF